MHPRPSRRGCFVLWIICRKFAANLSHMKHIAFLLTVCLLAALSSCRAPMTHATYYIDYQQAGQGKVFITEANSVSFEYEPLGSILVEETSGMVKLTVPTTEKERDRDDLYGTSSTTKTVNSYSKATAQTALNYAAQEAILLGGDGIINLRLTSVNDGKGGAVVSVSGMIIKRK